MECLDIHRVRKTISDFPVYDTLEPSPFLLSDLWKSTKTDECITAKSNSMNAQFSDSSSSYSSSGEDEDDFSVIDKYPELDIHWEAPDGDDRYSPGAIIPYILAILEAFEDFKFCGSSPDIAPDLEPERDADENPTDENKLKRETFVRVVYRLFQKGAAALVVSCLGSKCASIRKVAVAIIGKFLKALKMEESRTISGWKSRSQMEMALNAIQRGLLVARARKLHENNSSNEYLQIPMFPNVSALFLSRALLTLTKPGDDMYPAINKYFLRIDDHHGAYSDCFSLPIFMALFCSVNESDELIAKKERCFALQLLKDGTTDVLCYKVASKRHVPELLLTALSSFLSKPGLSDESECFLILGAIEKLVINGGDIAYRHYFKSVGLVPWFQTTIQSCISNVDFQSTSLLNAMIRLFRIILAKYQNFLEKEEDGDIFLVTLDSAGILLLLSNFHRLQLSSKKIGSPRTALSTSDDIVKIICSIHDIELICQKGQSQSYPFPFVQPSGFQVQMALALLESDEIDVGNGSLDKIITVFCKFSMEADLSNAEERNVVVMLCIAFIKSISKSDNIRMDRLDVSILVLRRISSLYHMISTQDTCYSDLLDHLLSFRKHAIKYRSLRNVWMECLRVMVKSSNDNSEKYLQLMTLLERLERDSISIVTLN